MLLLLMRLLLLFVCDDDDCNDAWNKPLKLSSQCDDAQALLGALPPSEEQELLGRAAPGVEECEAFARALMFAGARQQLMVIDTIMSFSDAAAHIVQSCRSISRYNCLPRMIHRMTLLLDGIFDSLNAPQSHVSFVQRV
jgi:hypothetical protein